MKQPKVSKEPKSVNTTEHFIQVFDLCEIFTKISLSKEEEDKMRVWCW